MKHHKKTSNQGGLRNSRRGSARHSNNSAASADRQRGSSPSKFQNSPAGGKGGVQFESETQDEDLTQRKKAKSESTDPLLTDSLSEED